MTRAGPASIDRPFLLAGWLKTAHDLTLHRAFVRSRGRSKQGPTAPHVDAPERRPHNDAVFRRVARATVVPLAVSFLFFGSGLAPLHAHESDNPHSHAVLHSHFEPHHQLVHHDDRELELDHGEHIVWLEIAVVHALPFELDAPAAILTPVPDPVTC